MKRYLLGIDFGHGETAASFYNVENGIYERAKISENTDDNRKKKKSVIYKDKKSKYSIQGGSGKTPIGSFKCKVSELNGNLEKKEAFEHFIKEIVSLIKKNNFEEDDIVSLYIACPTIWSQKDKEQYKVFFDEILSENNLRVEWIINESDAAFYQFNKDGLVLVVDYGSSTIDFTLMYNGKDLNIGNATSNELGAVRIEQVLYKKLTDTKNFESLQQSSLIYKEEYGDTHIKDDEILQLQLRDKKEELYTNPSMGRDNKPNYTLFFDYPFNYHVYGAQEMESYRLIYDLEEKHLKGNEEDEKKQHDTIKKYVEDVELGFKNVKKYVVERIKEEGIDTNEIRIILSGGASIMPWVKQKLKNVFSPEPKADDESRTDDFIFKVIFDKDRHPEYIVSDGIAKYAAHLWDVKEKTKTLIREFDKWCEEDNNLLSKWWDAIDEGCLVAELKELNKEGGVFAALTGKQDLSVKVITDKIVAHNDYLSTEGVNLICLEIKKQIETILKKEIKNKIANIFKNTLKINVEDKALDFELDVEKILLEQFSIGEKKSYLLDKIKRFIVNKYFDTGDGFNFLGISVKGSNNKLRDQNDRKTIKEQYEKYLKKQKSYVSLITDNELDEHEIFSEENLSLIKRQIIESLYPIIIKALNFHPCGYDLKSDVEESLALEEIETKLLS